MRGPDHETRGIDTNNVSHAEEVGTSMKVIMACKVIVFHGVLVLRLATEFGSGIRFQAARTRKKQRVAR